jgi:hypothetical protein
VAAELARLSVIAAGQPPAVGEAPAAGQPPAAGRRGARAWVVATITLTAGAAVAAIVLAPSGAAPAPEGLAFLLFAGSSVHVASTAWFYTVPEVRTQMWLRKARYLWWPLALISGAGAIAMLVPRTALYWLLLPYFGWQFFHYQKQNLGIAALAAASGRVAGLRTAERRALIGAGLAGIAGLLAKPSLLQVPVRPVLAPLFPVALVAFGVFVAAGAYCLAKRTASQRPAGFCVVYLMSLVFSLPVFLFSSPYAAVAGLTVAHGLQYLLLMGLLAGGGRRGGQRLAGLAALCNIALLGGAGLSIASDQLAARPAVRVLFGLFLGAVMAHFVIDAGIWRMRAEFPRSFLQSRLPYLIPASGARR